MRSAKDIGTLAGLLALVGLLLPAATLWQAAEGRDDGTDLSLVITFSVAEAAEIAEQNGGQRVGPLSAPFATFVQGTSKTFTELRESGSLIVPANGLAAFCATYQQDI